MKECIFCKIVNREIPATVVHEDDETLAFMDIGPIVKGHVLVIPKRHYNPITETPDEILAKLHLTAKKIAEAQIKGLGAAGINVLQNNGTAAGQEVSHLHIHVIPRFHDDGHHWNWVPKKYDDLQQMADLAEKIKNEL